MCLCHGYHTLFFMQIDVVLFSCRNDVFVSLPFLINLEILLKTLFLYSVYTVAKFFYSTTTPATFTMHMLTAFGLAGRATRAVGCAPGHWRFFMRGHNANKMLPVRPFR